MGKKGGARVARIGLGGARPAPEGSLVSFGLAGALVRGFGPGTLLTASRIVDERGQAVWEGKPLAVPGASAVTICGAPRVIDEPGDRATLAERTGAVAVDMESAALAATGRLVGAVRAVCDTPDRPLGGLAFAATPGGDVAWRVVARSFLIAPAMSMRATRGARAAAVSLEHAAVALAKREETG